MPANFVLLERIELNASAASVTFSSIPQTGYTDLKVVVSAMNTVGLAVTTLKFNGSSSGYTYKALRGSGSAAASFDQSTWGAGAYFQTGYNINGTTPNSNEIYIPNYAGATNKSVSIDGVQEANSSTAYSFLVAGLWSNTAAITSITVAPDTDSFAANSTFSLYGLAATGTTPVIAPKASGGNIIDYDGTYWIHTFLSSGTFTPSTGLSCDYLVVAGGGGGGARATQRAGGGGGAGGLRSTVTATGGGGSLESALALASGTAYTVTIGAGGSATGTYAIGGNGSNSVFSTITSTGGGGGGQDIGATGGSGGGGAGGGTGTGGSGTANQGRAGANGQGGDPGYAGGGGGGANTAGGTPTTTVGGAGGAGVATSITGSSVTYAGGGGGGIVTGTAGAGGAGGGGAGKSGSGNGVAGTTNLGAGGGGGGSEYGGNGGSGVVIIRYLA
jgi:hypothetical protein